jgi:hypothetical protein
MTFYYKVGEKTFHNKLQAIQENIKTRHAICLESPYGDADFSIEPQETLDELIALHLNELRNQYKNIRLYFSGGVDSLVLLQAFVKHGIHIDEIICLRSGIPTADFEIDQYALPTLKKLSSKLHKTKITIKTSSISDYYDFYKAGITDEKIAMGSAGTHNYLRLFWNKDLYGTHYDDDVLNIRGQEKPKIVQHGNDYYAYHLDGDLEPHKNNYQFFSANTPIHIKQSHMFLKTFTTMDHKKETDVWKRQNEWNKSIGRATEHDWPMKECYFGMEDNFFKHDRGKIYYSNNKDKIAIEWCIDHEPELIGLWLDNLEQLKSLTGNQWWNDNRPEMGSVGVFSKFYCLTKKSIKTVDELYPNGFQN